MLEIYGEFFDEFYDEFYNERLFTKRLKNGIECYIIPKTGFCAREAMVAVRYGSLCNHTAEEPPGTAHYMEHKMFEGKRGHAFAAFAKLGAEVNAFTNQTATAYYFSAEGRFEDCLRLLCRMAAEPYFTDENVEAERPVIEREIAMYDGDPVWLCRLELLAALYHAGDPMRDNIAGTAASIAPVTADLLYDAYKRRYRPANMAVIAVGDVEPEAVCRIAERGFKAGEPACGRGRGADVTPAAQSFRVRKAGAARPVFHIGLKDALAGEPYAKRMAAARIALDYLAGEGSDLCAALFDKGLADDTFGACYEGGAGYGAGVLAGCSEAPQAVFEAVLKEIRRLKGAEIQRDDFERLRRKHMGRLARGLNGLHDTAAFAAECFANHADPRDVLDAARAVTAADADRWIDAITEDRAALAVAE